MTVMWMAIRYRFKNYFPSVSLNSLMSFTRSRQPRSRHSRAACVQPAAMKAYRKLWIHTKIDCWDLEGQRMYCIHCCAAARKGFWGCMIFLYVVENKTTIITELILLWCTRRQYQAYRYGLHNLFPYPPQARSPGAVDMLHIEKSLKVQIVVELVKKVSTHNLFRRNSTTMNYGRWHVQSDWSTSLTVFDFKR